MSDFTHLHVHSHYSLLDGLGKIRPMLLRAKELGMDSIALTDHGAMYGIIDLIKTAKEVGIKPIVGVEAYLTPNGHQNKRGKIDANPRHLTLLAQNNAGYKNLIKLTTTANLHGYYYKPRIDYELLEQHHEGLIVLSGCINSDLSRAILENRPAEAARIIEWHLNIFGRDRYFLEVQDHPHLAQQKIVNEALVNFSNQYQIGLVATADSHYIHPEDAHAHDVLICVQTGTTVAEKNRMSMLDDDFSLTAPQALKEVWKKNPSAIDNTMKVAEMCQVDLEFGVNRLPRFPLRADTSADDYLREKCWEGLKIRYSNEGEQRPDSVEARMARLNYELEVIKKTGFASYFLIVADFVNEAKRRGILVGPGRGSAAGSFVSYLLNVTNLDPLQYNLLFERFLNPERVSMPDIDLDFADDRRDEVIAYVREKYGNDHVAQIITFGTMAARAAVRDAGRALGFPYAFCDQVAKTVPLMSNFEEALVSGSELKQLYDTDPQARRLIDTARRLEGVCRHVSTHAAGVVITDQPLTEYVPLQLSSSTGKKGEKKEDTVTQYPMNDVEVLGLLKVDFLGLKNLTIIKNTLDRVKARWNQNIDLDGLSLDDIATYKLLQEGKTTGVFQLESAGMKRYLKDLKPTEFEDIISMVALYRPGPMDSIPEFIAAKHGRKKIAYLHPLLQPIIEKTYGVIVTQDQVLQIAREFAGFTYGEADILRKAVGKKIKILLDEQREKFIHGARSSKNIDKKTAHAVWDFIEPFARYGFNRAHAACYAMIAYQTAYLKSHFPADFMAALLTSDEGNVDRAAIEVAEAMVMGITILPPDVNESDEKFTVVAGEKSESIRFGLSAIKNVGHGVVAALITERQARGPFIDLAQLFSRVNSKDFNRKAVESLARAGALDCLDERQHILMNVEKLLDFNRSIHKKHDKDQRGLFGNTDIGPPRLTLEESPAAKKEDRLMWEKKLLGMFVSEHPLTEFTSILSTIATPLSDLTQVKGNQRVRIAGAVGKINKIITKSNQPMLFVEMEDLTGSTEVLVFPAILHETFDYWKEGVSLIIEGKLSDKDGESKILTDKVWRLNHENLALFKNAPVWKGKASQTAGQIGPNGQIISLTIPASFSRPQLQQLRDILAHHHVNDGLPVELIITQNGERARLATNFRVEAYLISLGSLQQLIGVNSLRMR